MAYSYEPHYYEELEVGQTFVSGGRKITEADLVNYSGVSGDWNEMHTNEIYMNEDFDLFERRVAHGPFTFVVATGLMYRMGFLDRRVVAFVGLESMTLPHPVFIGDTLSVEAEVSDLKPTDRDSSGSVWFDVVQYNQDDEPVLEADLGFSIKKRRE